MGKWQSFKGKAAKSSRNVLLYVAHVKVIVGWSGLSQCHQNRDAVVNLGC